MIVSRRSAAFALAIGLAVFAPWFFGGSHSRQPGRGAAPPIDADDIWAANGDRTPWLIEGGKGTKPLAAHFQLRPEPLAK